jgi:hypothetical protein
MFKFFHINKKISVFSNKAKEIEIEISLFKNLISKKLLKIKKIN